MIRIATWIDADAAKDFARSFEFAPEVLLENARRIPVDLARADALLLTGGCDIAASSLKQPIPTPSPIKKPEPKRDSWDFAALAAALERGLPILAVCRGQQVLNVALGGTLLLDIAGHNLVKRVGQEEHPLRLATGVPEARRFLQANSEHHQAIDRLGKGLEVEAWCAADDVIEQVRFRDYPWCVGVQYHPERSAGYRPLFESFVRAILPRSN